MQLAAECEADVAFPPGLELFRDEPPQPDVLIEIQWRSRLPASRKDTLFDSGCTWRLYKSEAGFRFNFHLPDLGEEPYKSLFVDTCFSKGTLQMSKKSARKRSYALAPLNYPLDELLIMHRLTQERAIELHGCGIVRWDGRGNLFVGHSGAGKSTTTRLWTEREDVEILSDDRIIVRRDERLRRLLPARAPSTALGISARGSDAAHAPQLRLRDCSASRGNHSAQDDKAQIARNDRAQFRMYGTPWHGEARYASPGNAPVERIFILEHGQGNVLTRLSPGQAVAELFARSFVPFHRHEYVDSALAFLQEVTDAIPCYRYAFEPNESAVEKIANFRD